MTDPRAEELSFEAALAELERIVRDLEDGQASLEESLARYERGVALLKRCYGQLSAAEQRVVQVSGVGEDGQPITQPFEHSAAADPKPRLRARKPD